MPRLHAATALLLLSCAPAGAADKTYLDDLEFLDHTIRNHAASIDRHDIGWKSTVAAHRDKFGSATSDTEHVRNVMALLATLHDSHTGITNTRVPRDQLPSKFTGLYGAGLWFAYDSGRVMLRGITANNALAGQVPPGSTLAAVAGKPTHDVLAAEKARIVEFTGSSSDHSLFSSLGNRLLPFGENRSLSLTFITPDGATRTVSASPWDRDGKAFDPTAAQLPEGLAPAPGAVASTITTPFSDKVGYLRITGSMDARTAEAFHRAFDTLTGIDALVLDGRGMGGGSDAHAWDMAGRLFKKSTRNGPGRKLEPTGSWQFDGPVVFLQDERMVSAAETFTWAVSETGRVLSVGHPTGGWAIIPRSFTLPSGLASFRLGVTDRETPITKAKTEGTGWPPDLLTPYGTAFGSLPDPDLHLGLLALADLHAGATRKQAATVFSAILDGGPSAQHTGLTGLVKSDLAGTLVAEAALLEYGTDLTSAELRLRSLVPKARNAGLETELAACQKAFIKAKSSP